jgi:hypothetical protein
VVMWRFLGRTLRRSITREVLWSGNRERFTTQFATRKSLFLWALQTHWSRQNSGTVHQSRVLPPECRETALAAGGQEVVARR